MLGLLQNLTIVDLTNDSYHFLLQVRNLEDVRDDAIDSELLALVSEDSDDVLP